MMFCTGWNKVKVNYYKLMFLEPVLQNQTSMDGLAAEKSQLELEMREIYDKRESVAQWEAQISEIIKWYRNYYFMRSWFALIIKALIWH